MSLLHKAFRISSYCLHIAKYSVNVSDTTYGFIFKSNFTAEEQEKVLNILNGSSPDQLARFSVSKNRIKNLETWKTKKGPFTSLNDVLEVDGLGEKALEKICENIITDNVHETTNVKQQNVIEKRLKEAVSPPLSSNIVSKIQSTVAIHVGPMGISWVKLCRDQNEVIDWDCEGISYLPKKMLPTDTFDLAFQLISQLPPGDIYVLEAGSSMCPQATTKVSSVASYNEQLELTSMLVALLNTSVQHNPSFEKVNSKDMPSRSVENKVYHLRASIPARFFKTLIGRERVSALPTIMELVQNDGKSKQFPLPCTPVILKDHLKQMYLSKTPANKELLGQALLLVISFMDLYVYKNDISLVAMTGKNNGT